MRFLVLIRDGDKLLNAAIRPGCGVSISLGAEILTWTVDDSGDEEEVELVWVPAEVN